MKNTPSPIYESKSGRTTLSLVFTILMTGALFLVLALTQVISIPVPVDPTENGPSIVINPPADYNPPPIQKEEKTTEDEIDFEPDIDKVSIRDIDFLIWNPNGNGVKRFMTVFDPNAFEVENLIYDPEDLDTPPNPLLQPAPPYPPAMRSGRIEGSVSVQYIVTTEGAVRDIRITGASNREFVESVRNTLRRWSFEPGKLKNKAVTTRVKQTFHFNLK